MNDTMVIEEALRDAAGTPATFDVGAVRQRVGRRRRRRRAAATGGVGAAAALGVFALGPMGGSGGSSTLEVAGPMTGDEPGTIDTVEPTAVPAEPGIAEVTVEVVHSARELPDEVEVWEWIESPPPEGTEGPVVSLPDGHPLPHWRFVTTAELVDLDPIPIPPPPETVNRSRATVRVPAEVGEELSALDEATILGLGPPDPATGQCGPGTGGPCVGRDSVALTLRVRTDAPAGTATPTFPDEGAADQEAVLWAWRSDDPAAEGWVTLYRGVPVLTFGEGDPGDGSAVVTLAVPARAVELVVRMAEEGRLAITPDDATCDPQPDGCPRPPFAP